MEINEVVMVAMTVGAHKMRLMAEKGPAIPPADEVIEPGVAEEGEC